MSIRDLFLHNIEESPFPQEVQITGLPQWFQGSFYKVGNGKITLPSGFEMKCLFDCYSIIFQLKIENGKITYKSKYLNSDAHNEAIEFGKPAHLSFATKHYPNPNKKLASRAISNLIPCDFSDNTFENIFEYRNQIYTVGASYFMHHIHPDTLQSDAKIDLTQGKVHSSLRYFLKDNNGTLHSHGFTKKGLSFKYSIFKFNAESTSNDDEILDPARDIQSLARVSSSWSNAISITTCFGMTDNYFILVEPPSKMNYVTCLTNFIKGKTVHESITSDPEDKMKFYVIDRITGNIIKTKFISQQFNYVKFVNAYEENGCIVFDLITFKTTKVMSAFLMEKLRSEEPILPNDSGQLNRFLLPVRNAAEAKPSENLATGSKKKAEEIFVSPETLFDQPFFNIFINENYHCKKYRFGYSSISLYEHPLQKHLIKLDFETKEVKTWRSTNEDHFPTEPIFVPNPTGSDEDDGIIIAMLIEARERKWVLIFLDAKLFIEIARADFNGDICLGNFGKFIFKK